MGNLVRLAAEAVLSWRFALPVKGKGKLKSPVNTVQTLMRWTTKIRAIRNPYSPNSSRPPDHPTLSFNKT
jgi:hypothetical protein